MALSYECGECGRKWPYAKPFGVCGVCRTSCRTSQVGEPMSQEQARFELKKLEFNRRYAEREAKRVGPSPEDVGRAEARALIELDKAASGG